MFEEHFKSLMMSSYWRTLSEIMAIEKSYPYKQNTIRTSFHPVLGNKILSYSDKVETVCTEILVSKC